MIAAPPPSKILLYFLEEFFGGARKSEIVKSILLGSALNEQAAGLASVLCSGAAESPITPRPCAAPSLPRIGREVSERVYSSLFSIALAVISIDLL